MWERGFSAYRFRKGSGDAGASGSIDTVPFGNGAPTRISKSGLHPQTGEIRLRGP